MIQTHSEEGRRPNFNKVLRFGHLRGREGAIEKAWDRTARAAKVLTVETRHWFCLDRH